MRTDDDLTTLLRRGFTHATADLDPEPDLGRVVRRRYARARRRHLLVGLGAPAAVLAVGVGLVLAGRDSPNHTPSQTAVEVPTTAPDTPVAVKPASYKLVAVKHGAPPNCPANATGPVGKTESRQASGSGRRKEPASSSASAGQTPSPPAQPRPPQGLPRSLRHARNGVRAIYAPVAPGTNDAHPSGGWAVLTLSANAPQEKAVRLIVVPTNP